MASVGSAEFKFSANLSDLRKGIKTIPGLAKGAAAALDQQLSGGIAGASKEADRLAQKLESLGAKKTQIEATVEIKRTALNGIAQEIQNLEKQRIELRANGKPAEGAIAKIDKQLKALGAKKLKVEADIGAAKTNLNQVVGQIGKLEKKLKDAGGQAQRFGTIYQGVLQGIGQQLTVIAQRAAIAPFAGIASSIKQFQAFDSELQQFAALTGKTRDSIGPLNDEIQELGLTTSKSPKEVAATANALITLGASADQVQEQLSGVVALSEATTTGLELSGQVVQTVQNVFGEASDDIADKLTVLRNNTAASVEDVLQLASKTGSVGISLDEDFNSLAAAFATLRDSGFTAETAATALKTSLIKLGAPNTRASKAVKELGLEAFDAEGKFLGLEAVLPQLKTRLDALGENNDRAKLDLLRRIFGGESAPAILALLGQLDTKLVTTKAKLDDFAGTAAQSSETLNQGFAGGVRLLQGSVETLGINFGAAIEPALTAATFGIKDVVDEVLTNEGMFDELTASAQGFSDSLKDNPENVKQISDAVVGVVSVVQAQIAGALDALSGFLADTEKVDGLADAIAGAGSALSLAGDIVGTLSPLIGLAAKNSELFGVALQVIAVRMIAIKALGFVSSLAGIVAGLATSATATSAASLGMTGFGAATAGATTSLGAFAAASAAALGPLAALVAAVAAAQFLKFSQELRVANEEIEAIGNGAQATTGSALQLGQRLKNLNEQLAAEKRGEIQLSDEQIARGERLKTLAEEELKATRAQLAEARRIEPKNDAQRNSQRALIGQLEVSERAVQNQIDAFEVSLEARVDSSAIANSLPDEALTIDADTADAESSLENFQAASTEALSQIQQDSSARIQAVREAQRDGVKSEEEAAAEIAKIQADALADELAQKQAQLGELAGLAGDEEEIAQEKLKLEQDISQLSLSVVEAEVAEKKRLRDKELDDLRRANAQAEAAIAQSQNERTIAIRQSQLGGLGEDQAAAQIRQVEQNATAERIALKRQELNEVAALEARGVLSAEEAADRRIALNAEVGRLNLERVEGEIAAQKALQQVALETIANTLGAQSAQLGTDIERDRGQLDLLSAQVDLAKSLDAVENSRLQTQIASADASGDVSKAERLRAQLVKQQNSQIEKQAQLQQVQLTLQQKIQGVELERAKLEAEIALAEAKATGESERVLSLRKQQVQLANEAIARQADINQAQRDGLTAQQEVTREQQKQAQLADEQNRKEKERARLLGIISGRLNETDKDQAREALGNAEERFDLAAKAGLVDRGDRREFGSALSDVERLVNSGASDEKLLREAVKNRDNEIFQQLLKDIGRGDIAELAGLSEGGRSAAREVRPVGLRPDTLSQQFEGVQAGGSATGLDAVGQQIVKGLQDIRGLLAQNLARPYQLTVETKEDAGVVAAGVYAEQQKAALQALGG